MSRFARVVPYQNKAELDGIKSRLSLWENECRQLHATHSGPVSISQFPIWVCPRCGAMHLIERSGFCKSKACDTAVLEENWLAGNDIARDVLADSGW